MKEYELCCEIFNQCSNNQMRDVDFQEIEVEITREDLADGTVIYHTNTAGLLKRYSFTPVEQP